MASSKNPVVLSSSSHRYRNLLVLQEQLTLSVMVLMILAVSKAAIPKSIAAKLIIRKAKSGSSAASTAQNISCWGSVVALHLQEKHPDIMCKV